MTAATAWITTTVWIISIALILISLSPDGMIYGADLSLGDYEEGMPGLYHRRKQPRTKCPSDCYYDDKALGKIAYSSAALENYIFKLNLEMNNNKMSLTSERRRRGTALLVKDMIMSCKPGDVVETGTFTGGTTAIIVKMLQDFDRCNRTVYAFDSFEGLPDRDPQDMVGHSGKGKKGYFSVSLEQFIANMKAVNAYNETMLKVSKGWFKDTVPKCPVQKIAFLRMDGDMYASTRDVIWTMYDKVIKGGIVYADDYMGFNGCREAINEFRTYRRIYETMNFVMEERGKTDAAWWYKEN